jgi:hypothetical protein
MQALPTPRAGAELHLALADGDLPSSKFGFEEIERPGKRAPKGGISMLGDCDGHG